MSVETKKEVATREEENVIACKCDQCGRAKELLGWPDTWSDNIGDVQRVTISRTHGSYYHTIEATETGYDVCPQCWETVIVPLFEARGVKPRTLRER